MRAFVVLVALLVGFAARAAGTDCRDPQDQTSMNICADQDSRAADRALNTAYASLLSKTDKADAPKLRAAERAWIAYRDAECSFETAESVGGTIHPMLYAGCVAELTRAQTKRLQTKAAQP